MKNLVPIKFLWLSLVAVPSLACLIGNAPPTAIPVGLPEAYEVQVATATTDPGLITPTTEVVQAEAVVVVPLGDAPTHTPDPDDIPTATSTLVIQDTPTATATATIQVITSTVEITAAAPLTSTEAITEPVVATAPLPATEPDPPLQGGNWDFEADYVPWGNPFGEPCPGARVASGWSAFVEDGPYGSSCMNENLYAPNVFSGLKSQEITFDFITANSGVYRTIDTQAGHRYNIVAYAKHDRSLVPVVMALGVDFTGGTQWNAETVTWFPWDDAAEDTWVATEETVTATGERMTIFIKRFHPSAEQGGKTVIDNVSVTDLGR